MIAGRATLVLLLVVVPSLTCSGPDADADESLTTGQVVYALVWDTDRITRDGDGAWEVTNDLGYRIRLTSGWMVTYSVQLVPCPETTLGSTLRRWLGSGSALAGHGSDNDVSLGGPPRVESLTRLEDLTLGPVGASGGSYCMTHVLIARGDAFTTAVSEGRVVDGVSLHLEGSWTPPTGGDPTPFSWETGSNRGGFNELEDPFDSSSSGGRFTITRRPGELFDGIDMALADPALAPRAALKNLVLSLSLTPGSGAPR